MNQGTNRDVWALVSTHLMRRTGLPAARALTGDLNGNGGGYLSGPAGGADGRGAA